MSAVVTNFICSSIMSIMGFMVVRKLTNHKANICTIKNIILLIVLIVLPQIIHNNRYSFIYTILIYLTMTIVYKYIFKISLSKSFILCGVITAFLILLDLIVSSIFMIIVSIDQLRSCWYINLLSNIIISILLIMIFNIKPLNRIVYNFISKAEQNRAINYIAFFILTTIAMSIIAYIMSINYKFNYAYIISIIVLTIFFSLVIILINEKNHYEKLSDEYDNLFNYVKVFEDWIEKEQLNRHEYKNQLAAIRYLTKEKKVKDKIDSIMLDNINITNDTVNHLKSIPNGGLKGLLYYKISIAESNKLNVELDISIKNPKIIEKLKEDKLKILCRLVGIYLDNAIEGAKETRKKIISIEIYEVDGNINIVITNTFNYKKDIDRRNEKGFTTKGKGHGNGLHFAKKMLAKNSWLNEEQSIMDKYYIQRLVIKK